MNVLAVATYQASGIGREEPTDFPPIKHETHFTKHTDLTEAVKEYLIEQVIVAEDEIEDYLAEAEVGADDALYIEDDQVLVRYYLA